MNLIIGSAFFVTFHFLAKGKKQTNISKIEVIKESTLLFPCSSGRTREEKKNKIRSYSIHRVSTTKDFVVESLESSRDSMKDWEKGWNTRDGELKSVYCAKRLSLTLCVRLSTYGTLKVVYPRLKVEYEREIDLYIVRTSSGDALWSKDVISKAPTSSSLFYLYNFSDEF